MTPINSNASILFYLPDNSSKTAPPTMYSNVTIKTTIPNIGLRIKDMIVRMINISPMCIAYP